MAQYLNKFKDVIGKRQSEQILKLLNKKRNSGQIRTVQEFTSQLESLMRDLTSTTLIPSLSLFMAKEDEVIDADRYNDMLERVQDDLSAAFEEAVNIDEVQKSHEALIRDVILKNLRAGVAELESQIQLYEFINKDFRGFDSAIFSTFRESREGRTQRGGKQTRILFTDPRTDILVPVRQDATVELVGERLTLSEENVDFHTVVGVRQIFDSTSPQSEVVVEPPTSSLENIIDNTKGTYWIQSLLFKTRPKFVKVKLEFDLGTTREINVIEIEPASKYGLILEAVHYLDGNNIVTDLEVPEQALDGPGSVRFRKVATNRIILTFRNENPTNTQFEKDDDADPVFMQALKEPRLGYRPRMRSVNSELYRLIGSRKVRSLLGIRRPRRSRFRGYEFLTGIDNVRIGITLYEPKSTYVSSPLTVTNLGTLGLRTLETRPYIDKIDGTLKFTNTTYDLNKTTDLVDDDALNTGEISNTLFTGSIEYWVVKQDLNTAGALLSTTVFPVLPLGVERIYHERLVMTEKSSASLTENDLGTFVFFTNRTNGNIQVYRNGELLVDETGNPAAIEGWQEDPENNVFGSTANTGTRMSYRIKILGILPGDIITVSYNPMVSSTQSIPSGTALQYGAIGGLQVVDMSGDLSVRLTPGQIVVLDPAGENSSKQNSNVYLIIILRQNTAEPSVTPAVEEYTLLAGARSDDKFEEL